MTDEEKLHDYLKQHKGPEKKSLAAKPVEPKKLPKPKSPLGIYFRHAILSTFKLLLVSIGSGIGVTVFIWIFLPNQPPQLYAYPVMVTVSITGVTVWFARLFIFLNWVEGKYYNLKGWEEFIAKRSSEFWSKGSYTHIRIKIELKESATSLHRDAVILFFNNWVKNWLKLHDYDWVPGKGRPDDFKFDRGSIHGDLSDDELDNLIAMLSRKFIFLAKLLGTHLEAVKIESKVEEENFEVKDVKRDSFDRQSSWDSSKGF